LDELPEFKTDTITDERDHNKYLPVKIGNQIWIKGRIKYKAKSGKIYRKDLYDWEAAVCAFPQTFRIPSEQDWSLQFNYLHDSLIKRSSPQLIKIISESEGKFKCSECSKERRLEGFPFGFKIDSTIAKLGKYDFLKTISNEDQLFLMTLYLERIGFCTYGNGFSYKNGLGRDDYSYFWTSTQDYAGDHKYISLYSGDYCRGCGYSFGMPNNNKFAFNLKCVK